MASAHEHIVDLVTYLVTSLVDNPGDVTVRADADGDNLDIVITTHPDDIGKVIGRSGRTIKSIRTLARAAASDSPLIVEVDIEG